MKKILAIGIMLTVAAGFYKLMQVEADRQSQRVGGAPKKALDNVRSAAKRIEREEAERAAKIDLQTAD